MAAFDRHSRRYSLIAYLRPLLLLLVLGAFLFWRFWPREYPGLNPSAPLRAVTPRGDLADEEKTTIAIFREASPSLARQACVRIFAAGGRSTITWATALIPLGQAG